MKIIKKEDFDKLTFDEIDKKVSFIKKYKPECESVIRELNKSIDLDYVRQSEELESNKCCLYEVPSQCENFKLLRAEPPFPAEIPSSNSEKYLEFLDDQYKKSNLVVVYKNKNGEMINKTFKAPSHLSAVSFALKQSRQDRKTHNLTGTMPDVNSDFIEEVNAHLFKEKLQDGPIVGYGSYRGEIYVNGSWWKSNVKLADNAWEASDATMVYSDMEELIEKYNASTMHPIAKAILFKVRFTKIHPFRDGNGRTSRILLNYLLARFGYPTITIYANQREEYIKAMDTAILENNYAPLIELVQKDLNERCNLYIKAIKTSLNLDIKEGYID